MRKTRLAAVLLVAGAAAAALLLAGGQARSAEADGKGVLIVYHSGRPPWQGAPPLDQGEVDALTHATTEPVNVAVVAGWIRDELTRRGYRVDLRRATEVRGPEEFVPYDGIVFGTPTWFSNVAYPVKKLFDEHLIRIYEHREGRLNDKVLAGFATVMEKGESGPRCLQCLTWGLEHLSARIPVGAVVNVFEEADKARVLVNQFCDRFAAALEADQ